MSYSWDSVNTNRLIQETDIGSSDALGYSVSISGAGTRAVAGALIREEIIETEF